jgi:hypothetical protein
MSNIQAAAICTRVREVLTQAAGSVRTISSGTYTDDYPDGLDDSARERRALEGPRIRAAFALTGPARESPPTNSNLLIYDGTITVTIEHLLARDQQLDSDAYDVVQAAAFADADVVRQALEYPGNLTATNASAVTDIVSGCARLVSSSVVVNGQINDGAQLLTSTQVFAVKVLARPAVA